MRVPRSAGGAIAIFMRCMKIPRFASQILGPRRCTSDPCGFAAPPYQGGSAPECLRHVVIPTAIHSHQPWRRHEVRRNGKVCIARAPAMYFQSPRLRRAPLPRGLCSRMSTSRCHPDGDSFASAVATARGSSQWKGLHCAGPGYVLPIPAASPRPLTKGALPQNVYVTLSSRAQRGICFFRIGTCQFEGITAPYLPLEQWLAVCFF